MEITLSNIVKIKGTEERISVVLKDGVVSIVSKIELGSEIKYLSRAGIVNYLFDKIYRKELTVDDETHVISLLEQYKDLNYSKPIKPITIIDVPEDVSDGNTSGSIKVAFTGIYDIEPIVLDITYTLIPRGIDSDLGTNLYRVRNDVMFLTENKHILFK